MSPSAAVSSPVATEGKSITISAPNMRVVQLRIKGAPNTPLGINRFSAKQQAMVVETQQAGQAGKKKKRDPKDFERLYRESLYVSEEGWYGMNASSFRNAAISACRAAGYQMTKAKLAIFVVADGRDADDGTPLVRIYGEPKQWIAPVRNATGVIDMRSRARFDDWHADLRIRYDADMFRADDVCNLIMRVGLQVGIGEGRPDSKSSAGIGMGLFDVCSEVQ